MVEAFSCTTCPTCSGFVITVEGEEWNGAHYTCGRCRQTFMFKLEDEQGE